MAEIAKRAVLRGPAAREFVAKHGQGRRIVSTQWGDRRAVAVGGELNVLPAHSAGRFSDFLDFHLRKTLGFDWGQAQMSVPLAERHQILQLYDVRCRRERDLTIASGDTYVGPLTDAVFAWFSLAYDVYLIRHNAKLQERLVQRLKHSSGFQGARHELAVAATMVVAGFEIEFEDDGNVRAKHVEFVATDRSGTRIAVEAKSKHRPGVLGYRNTSWKKPTNSRFGIDSLLNRAVDKGVKLPAIAFVDLNVQPHFELKTDDWLPALEKEVREIYDEWPAGTFPLNAICFSNSDSLQSLDGRTEFREIWFQGLAVSDPLHALPQCGETIAAIAQAERQRRNIPTHFPE